MLLLRLHLLPFLIFYLLIVIQESSFFNFVLATDSISLIGQLFPDPSFSPNSKTQLLSSWFKQSQQQYTIIKSSLINKKLLSDLNSISLSTSPHLDINNINNQQDYIITDTALMPFSNLIFIFPKSSSSSSSSFTFDNSINTNVNQILISKQSKLIIIQLTEDKIVVNIDWSEILQIVRKNKIEWLIMEEIHKMAFIKFRVIINNLISFTISLEIRGDKSYPWLLRPSPLELQSIIPQVQLFPSSSSSSSSSSSPVSMLFAPTSASSYPLSTDSTIMIDEFHYSLNIAIDSSFKTRKDLDLLLSLQLKAPAPLLPFSSSITIQPAEASKILPSLGFLTALRPYYIPQISSSSSSISDLSSSSFYLQPTPLIWNLNSSFIVPTGEPLWMHLESEPMKWRIVIKSENENEIEKWETEIQVRNATNIIRYRIQIKTVFGTMEELRTAVNHNSLDSTLISPLPSSSSSSSFAQSLHHGFGAHTIIPFLFLIGVCLIIGLCGFYFYYKIYLPAEKNNSPEEEEQQKGKTRKGGYHEVKNSLIIEPDDIAVEVRLEERVKTIDELKMNFTESPSSLSPSSLPSPRKKLQLLDSPSSSTEFELDRETVKQMQTSEDDEEDFRVNEGIPIVRTKSRDC